MGVSSNPGDTGYDFEVKTTNIEDKENKASKKRGFQKFPMMLHKPQRLSKIVETEKDLAAALKQGWFEDVRDVPVDEDGDGVPDAIHLMTVDQAAAAIKKADAKQLAAYEADEQAHGNREQVVSLLSDAKDRLDAKGAAKADGAKPKRKAKGAAKAE